MIKKILMVVLGFFFLNGCASKSIEASDGTIQRESIESEGASFGWILGVIMGNLGGGNRTNMSSLYKASSVGASGGLVTGVKVADETQKYAIQEDKLHKAEVKTNRETQALKQKLQNEKSRNIGKKVQHSSSTMFLDN